MTTRNAFADPIEAPDGNTKILAKDGIDDAGYVTAEDILYTPFGTEGDAIALGSPGLFHIKRGTLASPITTSEPIIRIDKWENISAATQPNPVDNGHNASVVLYAEGMATSEVQTCGVWAEQRGGGSVQSADVCGLIGIGWVIHDNPRAGAGAYLEGRKTFTQNLCAGAELRALNVSGVGDTYNPAFYQQSVGAWVNCNGLTAADTCSAGVVVGWLGVNKFDVGFGVVQNSVISQAFRDDSSAVTSIMINGTHTTGIAMHDATISGAAISLPNNKYVMGRNVSDTLVNLFGINGSDQVVIGNPGYLTAVADDLYVGGNVFLTLANVPEYADDAAASAGGVPVGGLYRTASAVKVRAA